MNWNYTINIKDTWEKYSEYSHEDYDTDKTLFKKMKAEIIEALKKNTRPGDVTNLIELGILPKLKNARHLSTFNNAWNSLYDYCDYKRIWLKTNF